MTSFTGLENTPLALAPEHFQFLRGKIHEHSGIVIDAHKQYLLEARLTPLVQRRKLRSLNELSSAIRSSVDLSLLSEVIESITTHESYFFRDQAQFDALRTHLIPRLLARRQSQRRLRIWSAAASSGQEIYTVAIHLLEMGLAGWRLDLLATDISERILTRARGGVYSAHETAREPMAESMKKYFESVGPDYRIRESIRKMVDFRRFDLRGDMRTLGAFDVILCRNVLIYFNDETRRRILEGIASVLAPDGILFMGGTETTFGLTTRFTRKMQGSAVYYELATPSQMT